MTFTFRKLFNIDANAKTVKGIKRGFQTAVLYLAPFKMAGVQMCAMAELAGCWMGCLSTAGRGGIAKGSATMSPFGFEIPDNAIQRCRIARTRFYADDRSGFVAQLVKEIRAAIKRAARRDLTSCFRLNGTSDLQWEMMPVTIDGIEYPHIFAAFPDVQFYDYTKIAKRMHRTLPSNYHLTLSFSAASPRYAQMCFDTQRATGCSLAVVVRTKQDKARLLGAGHWMGLDTYDADESDLRFLDVPGSCQVLTAKGKARRDDTGFVLDID